jgi:hypothetical protein
MQEAREMKRLRAAIGSGILAGLLSLWCSLPVVAGDVGFNATFFGTSTDNNGEDQNSLFQNYTLNFRQPITPLLDFHFNYQAAEFDIRDDFSDANRSVRQPLLQLFYRRDTFNGMIGFQNRETDSTNAAEILDVSSMFAQFFWKPSKGPQYNLRWSDSSNVADVAVFGQDTDSTSLEFDASYFRDNWTARYSFLSLQLDNQITGFSLDQIRNLVQGTYDDYFWSNRLQFSADVLFDRSNQEETAPVGSNLAQPVQPQQGLFAFDPTPGISTLSPVPSLIDGDTTSPAGPPPIDIGGATFLNIGVDLRFTRQVTRLEISVDLPSDPAVLWQVFESPDNLNWTSIGGVASTWDTGFLRYTLEFPETTNRYFKAVNISANSQTNVLVTEIRALIDVAQDLSFDAVVGYDTTETTELRFQYFLGDFERQLQPVLEREEERYVASMLWDPLPTVDAVFSLSRREETEQGELLRRSDTLRARGITALYPGLNVTSEIVYNSVDDPFAGFKLNSWTWRETFDTQPTERLILNGGFSIQDFDTVGTVSISQRRSTNWQLTWNLPYVTVGGSWNYGREDRRVTTDQRYFVNWRPGPRLSLGAAYNQSSSVLDFHYTQASFDMSYRLNRYLNLFANYSSTGTRQALLPSSQIDTLQFGGTLSF